MTKLSLAAAVVASILFARPAAAQEAVPAGKGSYASAPPPEADPGSKKFESQELFLVKDDGRPIPTNKWWTQLVVSRFAKSLWVYPLKVDTSEQGLELFFPTRWRSDGNDPETESPLGVGGRDFKVADARAKDWSDWAVSFRMAESPEKYMDVTLGEGMPCTWVEYHGVRPALTLPPGAKPEFFDLSGAPGPLPASGDGFGVRFNGRQFGVFAPDGATFHVEDRGIAVDFAGAPQFLVICPLPAAKDIAYFHRFAYAVPRDTRLSWAYDPAKGMVTTTWKITAEALKGDGKQVIQGWIPHHYRDTSNDLALNGLEYLSPRGKLRCATGNEFNISYPYTGVVPNLPGPKPLGVAHEFDPARMHTYLAELASKPNFGGDTYWGGKDILRFGQCALMAQQLNDPTFPTFRDELRKAMADWYTYQPGKKEHFFAYYPRWKGLVGVKSSYGSEAFNDHHFHYGYFTFATALLAMHDPQFAADYGPMAKLVAADYANFDHDDRRFPFLRTFDTWAGHSWAGGTSSSGGENQESSSEAVQGWAGLIYLGEALGDMKMRDAGVMGYTVEARATMDYWFNAGGDVFPPEWKHPVTGMVWGGGKVFGTYFTGDPAWVYGINWLPASPMLSYLARDPAFARKNYENMCRDYEAHELADAAKRPRPGDRPHEARKAEIKSFGPALGSVMFGYVLLYDPAWVAEQLDTLWNEPGDAIAHNAGEEAVIYYQAHAMQGLGRVDWDCHGSSPTSMAFRNDAAKTRTYIVWNPTTAAQTVTFYEGDKPIGQLTAGPQALSSAAALSPAVARGPQH